MFSATMTEDVDSLIDEYFIKPKKFQLSGGTPLDNITQQCFNVRIFIRS